MSTNKEDMMGGSIICGVDDSESAKGAARVACALADELGLRLVFVCVVEADAPAAEMNAIAGRLEQLSIRASDVDCGADWPVEAGHPGDCLVNAATKADASGSISADVSRLAPCPVVVVPPGGDARVNGHRDGRGDGDLAGGIARFGLGVGGTDFVGGIARFGLGSP
jgi:nucleotide-binding universal stress UspA family protein